MGTKAITQGQAAAMLGVGVRRMQQIFQEGGGPKQNADGQIKPEDFGAWIKQRHREEFGVSVDGEAYDLNAERARLAKAQADKTEIEVAELHGELVSVIAVMDLWAQYLAAMRAKLLALPSKIAPRVSPPGLVAQTQELLRGIVDEALNELARDGLPERARKARASHTRAQGTAEADGEPVGRRRKSAEPGKQRRARKVADESG